MSESDLTEAIRAAGGGIERTADDSVSQRYVFDEGFPGFSGHFPGRPILPAVLQIMAAGLLVESATGRRLSISAIERAKFVNPISPGAPVRIACRRIPRTGAEVWEARLDSDRQEYASFFLTLLPREDGV